VTSPSFSLSGSYVLRCRVCFRRIFCSRTGHVVLCLVGKVSDDTLGGFLALLCGFSVLHGHGVSLSWSHVLGCRVCFSACFAAVLATSFLALFGMVSDDTLGTFSVLLCDFSALHWHGVSLSGSYVLRCRVCFFCSRAGHVVFSLFGKVSDDTLGGFLALLCGFSVLHGRGVSLSGSRVLGCRVWFLASFAVLLATSFLALLEWFQTTR